jgi:hypothetical protein
MSTQDELPDGAFFTSFPWWVVLTGRTSDGDGDARPGPDSGFVVLDADGSTCLAVFTDEDLAARFVDGSGLRQGAATQLESPRAFLEMARFLPPVCQYVAFDPPPRVGARARWVLALADVMKVLEPLSDDDDDKGSDRND